MISRTAPGPDCIEPGLGRVTDEGGRKTARSAAIIGEGEPREPSCVSQRSPPCSAPDNETMMALGLSVGEPEARPRRPAVAAIGVPPLVGPLVVIGCVLLFHLVFSLSASQPGLILYYLYTAVFWLPRVYAARGLSFVLTGPFIWAASRRTGGRSLLSALLCAAAVCGLSIAGLAAVTDPTTSFASIKDAADFAAAPIVLVPAVIAA